MYDEAWLADFAIIQDEAQQRNWTFYDAIKIIQDNNFESQCVISSLGHAGFKKVRDLNPDLKIVYIIAKVICKDISR